CSHAGRPTKPLIPLTTPNVLLSYRMLQVYKNDNAPIAESGQKSSQVQICLVLKKSGIPRKIVPGLVRSRVGPGWVGAVGKTLRGHPARPSPHRSGPAGGFRARSSRGDLTSPA